jgi:hypothetical protein
VEDDQPRLLTESREFLPLRDSHPLPKGRKNVFHCSRADAGEDSDPEHNKIAICKTCSIFACGRVEVRQGEELDGVFSRLGYKNVGEKE